MINSRAPVTYAQYNEDLILSALLHDVKKGFYVDIGASYPDTDSVTKLFYQKGWRGINVEPIESIFKQLVKNRPRDINLQCGAGSKRGRGKFREYTSVPGHSTFNSQQKKEKGPDQPHRDYEVDTRTLADIFHEHSPRHIHFLKIDVEGFEYDVITGNDWSKYKPEIVCIEANHVSKNWSKILQNNSYRLFIKDGLNEYYVAEEAWSRTINFVERVTALSREALKYHHKEKWLKDSKDLEKLTRIAQDREEIIKKLDLRFQEVEPLSLKNHSLRTRIKRAIYGITLDWYRFKKERAKK